MNRPRSEIRQGFTMAQRTRLLEDDADTFQADLKAMVDQLRRMTWAFTSATITLAVSSVLLLIQSAGR
jgi:hypothetical protein